MTRKERDRGEPTPRPTSQPASSAREREPEAGTDRSALAPPAPDELRAWMDRHGYSVRSLATALGMKHSTVWRYTSGHRAPPPMLTLALRWLEEHPEARP